MNDRITRRVRHVRWFVTRVVVQNSVQDYVEPPLRAVVKEIADPIPFLQIQPGSYVGNCRLRIVVYCLLPRHRTPTRKVLKFVGTLVFHRALSVVLVDPEKPEVVLFNPTASSMAAWNSVSNRSPPNTTSRQSAVGSAGSVTRNRYAVIAYWISVPVRNLVSSSMRVSNSSISFLSASASSPPVAASRSFNPCNRDSFTASSTSAFRIYARSSTS